MCNLYRQRSGPQAILDFTRAMRTAVGNLWFKLAGDEPEPLAFFAGIHVPGWTCARKIKNGVETIDLMAFMTTEPSEPVKSVHPKAMPVILTTREECEAWMTDPWDEVKAMQRALPDGTLVVVD